jgi:carbonic anhydrase/acetyltransferase-like protein (isoleucine patch superfamily)
VQIAGSAVVVGTARLGEGSILAEGAVIRSEDTGVEVGTGSAVLENTVLHLLPDNDLVIDDGVIVGPGAMIHGCRIGARSVIEPGAIVCDSSVLGAGCVVRAGAVVKQRSRFVAGTDIDGFPAVDVGQLSEPAPIPSWAFRRDDLPIPAPAGPRR